VDSGAVISIKSVNLNSPTYRNEENNALYNKLSRDSARAESDGAASDVSRLISATFFSDACRQRTASLHILSTTDAQFLIEAFAQGIGAEALDLRAERRAGSADTRIEDADCGVPAVALINLLRLNGLD
jgi:hypothetical protein